jgi:hypothetical protein
VGSQYLEVLCALRDEMKEELEIGIRDRITKLLDRIAFQKFWELIGITTGTVQKDRRSYRLQGNL